jgi:D-alanine transaminase
MCNIKTLNLLPAVIASRMASECGCDEFVFIRQGIVTECAHSNISIIKNGVFYTHPDSPHILPGITKNRLLYYCRKLGIECIEAPFDYEGLTSSDAVIVSSTTKLALLASEIDGKRLKNTENIAAKRLIFALREEFLEEKVN